ncbi:jg616 [Pararge aegeria aegeria]|uniref:Jg616 protein n=1 Tax=Pararge aegeria aegeria TaxID=348720 RepID=A0A8S4QXH1_9NEOP|nr:jg616 [Pararge aegeria aegeria]
MYYIRYIDLEIRRRCAITRSAVEKLNKIWKDKRITKTTKTRLMRCLVFPIFLYGAATWSLRLQDRRKNRCPRDVVLETPFKDPLDWIRTNNSILKELNIKERLSSTVQLRIFKFFGHISRNEGSIERSVVQGQVEGKRARGRSPTRWIDTVKSLTQTTVVECFRHATNRQRKPCNPMMPSAMKFISAATTTLPRVHD